METREIRKVYVAENVKAGGTFEVVALGPRDAIYMVAGSTALAIQGDDYYSGCWKVNKNNWKVYDGRKI